MIESLTTIISNFAGEANRVQCLAHIVNLVVKVILHQFNVKKKKVKKDKPAPDDNIPDLAGGNDEDNGITEEEVEEVARVLDKEEKEMDEGDKAEDEESNKLVRHVEEIEEAMGRRLIGH